MKDVYIVQCLMETDLYKLLKTQVKKAHTYSVANRVIQVHDARGMSDEENKNNVGRQKQQKVLERKLSCFRLLVMTTYVIFCTKYCED